MANADAISRMPFDELPFKPPIPAPDIIDEVVIANVSDANDSSMCQDAAFENLEPTSSSYIITFGVNTPKHHETSINMVVVFEPSEDIVALQHECSDFKDILRFSETQELPTDEILARKITFQADQFCIDNSILYHLTHVRNRKSADSESVVKQLLSLIHI